MNRTFILLLVVMVMVSCHPSSDPEIINAKDVNPEAPYIWRGSFPKKLYLDKNLTSEEVQHIELTISRWEKSNEQTKDFFSLQTSIIPTDYTSPKEIVDDHFVIYKMDKWPPEYSDNSLAITQLMGFRYNIGEASEYVSIEHADIMLNFEHFKFSVGGNKGFDLKSVLIHELGHFLGLTHPDPSVPKDETVMYPYLSSKDIRDYPTENDLKTLREKYPTHPTEQPDEYEGQDVQGEPVIILIEHKHRHQQLLE